MNDLQSEKKFIVKSFLSYLIVLLAVIILLSAYAFRTTRKALLDSINDINVSLTQQAYDFTEQFYEMVRSYSANLFHSRLVKRLRTDAEISNADYIEGMRELRTYASSTDYVHSIYLYNAGKDYIYTTLDSDVSKGSAPSDCYFDTESVTLLKSGTASGPIYRSFPYGGADESVISFLTYEKDRSSGAVVSSMAVNVSPRWLEKFMNSLAGMRNLAVYLKDGTPLIKNPEIPLSDREVSLLLQLPYGNENSYMITKINGVKTICFRTFNNRLDCCFMRLLSYDDCLKDVLTFRRNMIFVIAVLTLLGIAGCALLVRKFYLPAKKLLGTVPLEDAEYTSLSSLDDVIDLAADRLESYQSLMKTDALRQLLLFRTSEVPSQEQLHRKRIQLNAELPATIILVKSGIPPMSFPADPDGLLWEQVGIDSRLVYIVQGPQEALNSLLQQFSVRCGFCAFSRKTELSGLSNAYTEVLEVYLLRIFLAEGCYSTDILGARGDTVYPKRIEMRIISALTSGSEERVLTYLHDFMDSIADNARYDVLLAHLSQLYCTVAEQDTSGTYSDLDPRIFFEISFAECESPNDLEKLFATLFHRVAEQSLKARLEQNQRLVERVKNYLETNYTDPEITPVSIADMEGVSADFLSDLFKTAEQTSIAKYLLQIRMRKAGQLLCSTTIPVKEIARMVGISNPQYFFTLFKTAYGATPNAYRESHPSTD